MHPGYINDKGHVFYRCGLCGDSENKRHAHAFVDQTGNTYCYRCGESTRLSLEKYLYVALGACDLEEVMDEDWKPFKLPTLIDKNRRDTLLVRYVVADDTNAESFSMRDNKGELIGYHTRYPNKVMLNEGQKGICWVGADDGVSLLSSSTNPLYVVEGPYDVTKTQRVATYGTISLSTMKYLKAQTLWAWPDPDVIDTRPKLKKFVNTLNIANDNYCWVEGLIVSDKDPDVCTIKRKITLAQANEYVRTQCHA